MVLWLAFGCVGHGSVPPETAPPPVPSQRALNPIAASNRRDDVVVSGQPLLTLRGPPLRAPLDVPLWLELESLPADEQSIAATGTQADWFALPGERVYIEETNTGVAEACRVYQVETGMFIVPDVPCVTTEFLHHSFQPLDDGVVAAFSDAEGCATFELLRWDERAGTKRLWATELGCNGGDVQVEPDGGGVRLTSNCDLSAGGCHLFDATRPVHVWRWSEKAGLSAVE